MSDDAKVEMILAKSLNEKEQAKFDRLEKSISEIVHCSTATPSMKTIRVCEGKGESESREICFTDFNGTTMISFSAAEFLADSDEKFLRDISDCANV